MIDDLINEGAKSHLTALDDIERILNHKNERELKNLFDKMVANQKVVGANYKPTLQQFGRYFEQVKKGLEYAKSTYGDDTIPSKILVSGSYIQTGQLVDYDFIAYYKEEDALLVSYLHIAGQCSYYENRNAVFIDNHLPAGFGVNGTDYTFLQALEEGYHRYQQKALGVKPETTHGIENHPLEMAIIPIYAKVIEDLSIPLIRYKIKQDG